jgi:Domain of unknown function (DUF4115)
MIEPDQAFVERRVLEELEAFQRAIGAARAQEDPARSGSARPAALAPVVHLGTGPAGRPAASSPARLEPVRPELTPASPADGTAAASVRPRSGRRVFAVVGGMAAVVSLGVAWTMTRSADPALQPAVQQQPAAVEPEPARAAKPAPAIDPHALRVDLTTLRRVWLRVAVDGRIAIEREVAAGEQLPFGADRSIVVRAGDAGAVTVKVAGVDQGAIGRDGQVVTRAFEAPAR